MTSPCVHAMDATLSPLVQAADAKLMLRMETINKAFFAGFLPKHVSHEVQRQSGRCSLTGL